MQAVTAWRCRRGWGGPAGGSGCRHAQPCRAPRCALGRSSRVRSSTRVQVCGRSHIGCCAAQAATGLLACLRRHQNPQQYHPPPAGGIASVAATGWRVQSARDAVLLETAWGCGGRVSDVLLQGWAVGNATSDVLRVNARSHACEVIHNGCRIVGLVTHEAATLWHGLAAHCSHSSLDESLHLFERSWVKHAMRLKVACWRRAGGAARTPTTSRCAASAWSRALRSPTSGIVAGVRSTANHL
jgi:hypothetical protein